MSMTQSVFDTDVLCLLISSANAVPLAVAADFGEFFRSDYVIVNKL